MSAVLLNLNVKIETSKITNLKLANPLGLETSEFMYELSLFVYPHTSLVNWFSQRCLMFFLIFES